MNNLTKKRISTRFAFLTLLLWIPATVMAAVTMSGTVRNQDSLPISQATISIYGPNNDPVKEALASAKTDAQGKYSFNNAPQNGSMITATADGYEPYNSVAKFPSSGNVPYDILLWPAFDTTHGPTMTGTVRDKATALPISQARLSLFDWNPATNKTFLFTSAITNAQGKYKFDSLPKAGDGTVEVTHDGYQTLTPVILYPMSGNTVWNYEMQAVTTAIGIGDGLEEGTALTWRRLSGGNTLLSYPILSKDASLRGYLPSGELVFKRTLPAQSKEWVITRASGNGACYFSVQPR